MKLTQRRIDDLECPLGKKDALFFDDEQAGLGVRVTASGGKTYLAQYRLAGAKRRVPLGSCSAISLAGAREAVRSILGDVAKGRDPAAERKEAAAERKRKAAHVALTLAALLEKWEAIHLVDKRQSYASEAVRALRHGFPKQLTSPAADLCRADVVRLLDTLTTNGKAAMAARTAAYGHACYHWAIKRGSVEANPFASLPVAPVEARERVLKDDELRAIWHATAATGSFNSIVRMLILTGQRREEVAGMTWDEVSGDLSTWIIPGNRAKNGVAHVVPMSRQAQAILATARDDYKAPNQVAKEGSGEAEDEKPRFVFPGQRRKFNGFGKSKALLDADCSIKDWRLHDLRRSMATGLQRLGVRLEVTEAVLNHVSGSRAGIVGIYQRHDYASEKQTALAAWGGYVAALVEQRTAEHKVIRLTKRA